MIIKRKNFSDTKNQEPVKKERFASIKKGINYAKTHTFKETATAAGKGIGKYVKKNPDEAVVLTGSYTIPGVLAAKLLKTGKKKEAALVGSIAAFPIGEGYIAAKKGIQVAIKKNNEVKSKQKQFSSREKVPSDIAKEGKKSGVIQKDKNGVWRIISYKTNPPEFWDAHYDTREDAEKALDAYHANKGK